MIIALLAAVVLDADIEQAHQVCRVHRAPVHPTSPRLYEKGFEGCAAVDREWIKRGLNHPAIYEPVKPAADPAGKAKVDDVAQRLEPRP